MKLVYELSAVDNGQLRRVIRSTEAELKASSRRVASESKRSTGGSGNILTGGGDHQYWRRAMMESGRLRERQERQVARTAQREAATKARQDKQAAGERAKQAFQEAQAADRSTKAKARLEQAHFRQKVRMQNRHFAEEQRNREKLDRQERSRATRADRARARAVEKVSSGVGTSVRGAVGGIAAIGGTALGVAGGFAAANALRDQVDIRARAAQLANQAGDPSLKGKLAQEAQGVRGFIGGETLGALEAFVTPTGDLGAARGMLQELGTIALATGTDFSELSDAAGQAFNVIRDTVKDPQEQLAMLGRVMSTMAGQGNLGAVEIRDLATEMATLGAATRKYAGGPEELLKSVGAMAQASRARGGAASSAEASTSVVRFAGDMVKHTDEFQQITGKSAFADKGKTKLRGPEDLMVDLLQGSGGDLTKIKEVFGEYGERTVGGFSPLYTKAEEANAALPAAQRQKKGKAGEKAVREEFHRFTNAGMSKQVLNERANSRLAEPDMQFKEATKAFNLAVGTQLLPALTQLVPAFKELIPQAAAAARAFAKIVTFFAQNPFTGIGLIIAGAIVKDLVAAKIGAMVKGAFAAGVARLSGGGRGSSGVGTEFDPTAPTGGGGKFLGKPTAGAALAAAGVGATIGLTVATAIITAGVANFETGEEAMKASGQNVLTGLGSTNQDEVRRLRNEEQTRLEKRKSNLGFFGSLVGGIFGQGAGESVAGLTDQNRQVEINTGEQNVARLDEHLQKLAAYDSAAEKISASATTQKEAAEKLSAVADKLGLINMPARDQPIISKNRT